MKRRVSARKSVEVIIHILYIIGMEQVLEVPGPADIVVETPAVRGFIIMRTRSYLL